MYFKAYITISTENLWKNPETNEYEGCDPDSYQDHGIIREIQASTLEELRDNTTVIMVDSEDDEDPTIIYQGF